VAGARGAPKGKRERSGSGGPEASDSLPPVRPTVKGPRGTPEAGGAQSAGSEGSVGEPQGEGGGGRVVAGAGEELQAGGGNETEQKPGGAHKDGAGSGAPPAAVPKKRGRPRKYPLPTLPSSTVPAATGGGGGGEG